MGNAEHGVKIDGVMDFGVVILLSHSMGQARNEFMACR